MIGIVVVTHGCLAKELVAATEHIVGRMDGVRSVCVGPDDDLGRLSEEVHDAVTAVEDGSGVVIVTDIFGGTPANLATAQLDKGKVEVVAGANLSMLIRLWEAREGMSVEAAAEAARDAGRRFIAVAGPALDGGMA